ncbi:hypothetical protein PUR49_00875 [Streptomyces sp. BE147]|uniref:hypothetical protein n=1 Tax=Streptomyces sp. BE147 TaxID=3002524 RepID=UPI002E75C4F7|nr:hypothetical protein [Streptomyces sp. BE147]MEE1735112.1 hypothetical protein [Streptomyces sp. BE147]
MSAPPRPTSPACSPGVRIPDLDELRARGVLGASTATPPAARRTLGTGGHADGDTPPDSSV